MLRKREAATSFDQIDTLVGGDTVFRGAITAAGTVRIDGKLEGEVTTKGDIVIGESGQVEGTLQGRNLLVAGEVQGNIIASGKVEMASTGQVFGDIKVGSLVVDSGAVFHGNCQMEGASKDSIGKKAAATPSAS